jgi:hypothetical protein
MSLPGTVNCWPHTQRERRPTSGIARKFEILLQLHQIHERMHRHLFQTELLTFSPVGPRGNERGRIGKDAGERTIVHSILHREVAPGVGSEARLGNAKLP